MSDDRPYFLHRHPEEGPPRGVRVSRLSAASLAEWAARLRFPEEGDGEGTIGDALRRRLTAELSDRVHALRGIGLADSATADLYGAYVPRGPGDAWERWADVAYAPDLRGDEQSLRVLTDDDETESVYVLVDAAVVRARPGRFAYLLHTAAALPEGTGPAGFAPEAEPASVVRAADGPGAVFIADFSMDSSSNIDEAGFHRLDGVRLPDLLADPALLRIVRFDWLLDALDGRPLAAPGAHVARVHVRGEIVLFDDLWAGAHPDLAASMLWTAWSWDPLGVPDLDG